MSATVEVTVPANPDVDDCLTDAAEAYLADHPALEGWDLAPRWTDDSDRETVTLTVPAWSVAQAGYPADSPAEEAADFALDQRKDRGLG